jgi:chromosome partitioning protein
MISILVANTKGGCGKTTISTHLAAAFAAAGHPTALADADRQRSSLAWAGARPGTAAPITALDWVEALTAPPRGTARLVIDAAAAMKRRHVFDLVKEADVIIVPVLPSAFDQTSTGSSTRTWEACPTGRSTTRSRPTASRSSICRTGAPRPCAPTGPACSTT